MKPGKLNSLEHSGPLQACNGTALPLSLISRGNFELNKSEIHDVRLRGQSKESGKKKGVLPGLIWCSIRSGDSATNMSYRGVTRGLSK